MRKSGKRVLRWCQWAGAKIRGSGSHLCERRWKTRVEGESQTPPREEEPQLRKETEIVAGTETDVPEAKKKVVKHCREVR